MTISSSYDAGSVSEPLPELTGAPAPRVNILRLRSHIDSGLRRADASSSRPAGRSSSYQDRLVGNFVGCCRRCLRSAWHTVRESPSGFHPRKSSFYPNGERHSSPQKRARWPPVTANGVPAELGERAPAEQTSSASGRSKAPVRRAPCSAHMDPPPFCTHV